MFLMSQKKLAIGEVCEGVSDHLRQHYPLACFLVLRQATQRDWWEQVAGKGEEPRPWPDAYFYEVAMD